MVSPTPLSSNVARKIERSRRISAKTGDLAAGRRANQTAPPSRRVVWPRGAPYGLRARPWRPSPHLVARSRFGDSSRSGDGLARRARVGARGGIGLRSAPSTNFGWPCARAASRPRPPRSTSRGPRKSDRDAAAALSGPPGAGGPWRASATSARRRPSVDVAERTPIESEVDRAGFVLAQLISDGAIPASEPRRGGATRRPDEGRCRRTPLGSLASLFPRGACPLAPARVGGGPRDVAPNAPRTRSGSHPVARLRGPVGHASDDASQRIGVLLLVVRDGRVRLRRCVQGGGHHDRRRVRQRERLVVRLARGRRLRARARARARVRRDGVLLLLVLDGRPV